MKFRVLAVAVWLSACRMSCFAPPATPIDAPITTKLRADGSTGRFEHSEFDALLKKHANPVTGRVDYQGIAQDRPVLDAYVRALGTVDIGSLATGEQKALLLNAYNAFTLLLILENYPKLSSIKDLSSPWKQQRWLLAGDTVSLDDIEHGLLRPTYRDPRIHFGVNCASIGCPPLQNWAFDGARVEAQLDETARATLTNPRYARVDGETLYLTSLLNWYGDDFTNAEWSPSARSIREFVVKFAPDVGATGPVEFVSYDWRLNDVERQGAAP